ncbi:MAG: ABC transporter permease [Promethearchaeota archaeon]
MNLGGLIKKEFSRIKSDKRTLILLFVIPIILIVIFGLTAGGGPTKFFTGAVITKDDMPTHDAFPENSSIHDDTFISVMEHNTTSWDLYRSFNTTNLEEYNEAFQTCIYFLKNELIDVFIILPENFSESVENNTNPVIFYHIDGTDSGALSAIEVALQEPLAMFRIEIGSLTNFTIMIPHLEFGPPSWESQILNYALPLILPIIIIATTMNLTALSIVSEKPLPRMLITPTAKREILLSKIIANSVIMIMQATEIFTLTAFFGLYSLGSLFYLFLVLIMIGFSGICMGLFISTISPTEQGANQMYMMMLIIIIIFSGTIIPAESLGSSMRIIIDVLPLGHASVLISDITLRGLSFNAEHVIMINLISLVFLILAYFAYKFKKLEV